MAESVFCIRINYDILDQFKAHLTSKLCKVYILLQSGYELINIFCVVSDLLLSIFDLRNRNDKFILLFNVLFEKLNTYALRDSTADLRKLKEIT